MDLAEWMETILNEEFNLILEDNSLETTAASLLKCAKWIRTNNEEKLSEFTATLPTDEQVQAVTSQSQDVGDSSSDESDDDEEEAMDAEDTTESHGRQPRTVTDEDGWTTILPRQQN
ncbi:Protein Y51H4A.15 [Aphelenchoides avenae]|nr:Protein Y51H4A.15 [Aphelenchus avenae]